MALTSILVARLLGPEKYGLYTIVLIVPNFLILLSELGISSALIRYSAQLNTQGKGYKAARLIKIGILFKIAVAVSISLILLIVSEHIAANILNRPSIGIYIKIASIHLIGQSVYNTVSYTFIGLDETGKSSILMNIRASVKAFTTVLLIIVGFGLAGAVIGIGLGAIIAALTGVIMLMMWTLPKMRRNASDLEKIGSWQALETLIVYGAPIYFSTAIKGFTIQLRQIFLVLFTADINFGNYKTAMNFATLLMIIARPMTTSLFSAFSKLDLEKDKESIEKMFQYAVKYTSLIVIPASMALAVLSQNVVFILYGDQYNLAPFYLKLYMMHFLGAGLGLFVINGVFNSQGDTGTTFKIHLINNTILIIMSLILIPRYYVIGLIVSIIVSHLVSTLFSLYKLNNMYGINLDWVSSLRIIIAALSSALLVHIFLNLTPVLPSIYGLTLGGILYIGSFLVFAPILRAIKLEDLNNLESLLSELPIIYPLIKIIFRIEKKIISLCIGAT